MCNYPKFNHQQTYHLVNHKPFSSQTGTNIVQRIVSNEKNDKQGRYFRKISKCSMSYIDILSFKFFITPKHKKNNRSQHRHPKYNFVRITIKRLCFVNYEQQTIDIIDLLKKKNTWEPNSYIYFQIGQFSKYV